MSLASRPIKTPFVSFREPMETLHRLFAFLAIKTIRLQNYAEATLRRAGDPFPLQRGASLLFHHNHIPAYHPPNHSPEHQQLSSKNFQ